MGVVFAIYTAQGAPREPDRADGAVGVAGLAAFVGALGATFFLAMLGALAVVLRVRLWTGEIRTLLPDAGRPRAAAAEGSVDPAPGCRR